MRTSREKYRRYERAITVVSALLSGVGALSVAAVIMAAVGTWFDLSGAALNAMSSAALAAGCFACAFTAANRRRRHGLSTGLVCGIAVFSAVMLLGAVTYGVFSAGGILAKLLVIVSGSCIGGIVGVNSKKIGNW